MVRVTQTARTAPAAAGTVRGLWSHEFRLRSRRDLTLPTSEHVWRGVPGVDESRANIQALSKQIFGLESRLEQSQKRCNTTLVQNKRLRERITKLREERIANEASYAEAERQLIEKKAELARITAESIDAYETRDAAHVELRRLRAQEEREHAEFEKEWREMARMMERDKLMKDFMRKERAKLKGKERIESEGATRRVRWPAHALRITARERHVPSDLRRCCRAGTDSPPSCAPPPAQKSGWGSMKESVTSGVTGSYEEAFKEISAATGIKSLDELVSSFIRVEDSNFEIFNHIGSLSAECQKLEQHIAEMKSEVDKCKGNGLNADNQRKKTLKELEDMLKAMEAQSELYEKKCEAAAKTVRGTLSRSGYLAKCPMSQRRTLMSPTRPPGAAPRILARGVGTFGATRRSLPANGPEAVPKASIGLKSQLAPRSSLLTAQPPTHARCLSTRRSMLSSPAS